MRVGLVTMDGAEIAPPAEVTPPAELLAMLDADLQGWAIARSVRVGGEIVDFELVYLNEAGGRMLGRSRSELLGRRYRELWPETMHDGTMPLYRQVVDSREPAVRTVYYDRVSVAGHFEIRIGPCGDGFIARFVDLAKITLAPQSEGGPRLYDVLDAAFDGFTLLRAVRDSDGVIVDFVCEFINQVGAKLAGRAVADTIGTRIHEMSPGSVRSGLLDRYREVAETGEPWSRQMVQPDGGEVWEIKVVRAEPDLVAVSYREITDQVDQERQLARSSAQAREAAERNTALQAVTAALVAASTSAQVYAAMGSVVRPSAGGRGIAVLLREDDRLVLAYHAGYEPDVIEQLRELPLSHPYPATEVSVTGRPRYLCSPREFLAAQPDPATAVSGGGRRAWAFLPLATAGQVLGAMVIGYIEPRQFDDGERANLTAFSGLCAQALQRAAVRDPVVHRGRPAARPAPGGTATAARCPPRRPVPAVDPGCRRGRRLVRRDPAQCGHRGGGDRRRGRPQHRRGGHDGAAAQRAAGVCGRRSLAHRRRRAGQPAPAAAGTRRRRDLLLPGDAPHGRNRHRRAGRPPAAGAPRRGEHPPARPARRAAARSGQRRLVPRLHVPPAGRVQPAAVHRRAGRGPPVQPRPGPRRALQRRSFGTRDRPGSPGRPHPGGQRRSVPAQRRRRHRGYRRRRADATRVPYRAAALPR
jgi:GAF domain/PAS fold